jgi:hypothetical protein
MHRFGWVLFVTASAISATAWGCPGCLPKSITFDGHCDGLTDIRFIGGHETTGSVILATWDRSACGQADAPAAGITGHDQQDDVTGTFDQDLAGMPPMVLRVKETVDTWLIINTEGHVLDWGTWTEGAPGSGAVGLPPLMAPQGVLVAKVDALGAGSAPVKESPVPSSIRFDGHCDGIINVHSKRIALQTLVSGTWALGACGQPSTTFSGMGNGNNGGPRRVVGAYDTYSQGLGYPSILVEIGNDRTWIYRNMDGTILTQGTWTEGTPQDDGPVSISP